MVTVYMYNLIKKYSVTMVTVYMYNLNKIQCYYGNSVHV